MVQGVPAGLAKLQVLAGMRARGSQMQKQQELWLSLLNKNHYTYSNITSAATRLHLQSPSLTVAITSIPKTTTINLPFKESCITSTILTVLATTFRATFYYWY